MPITKTHKNDSEEREWREDEMGETYQQNTGNRKQKGWNGFLTERRKLNPKSLKGSKPIKIKHLQKMDPEKLRTWRHLWRCRVDWNRKTAWKPYSRSSWTYKISPNLEEVITQSTRNSWKTLYRNHGTKEIWAPNYTHTPSPSPSLLSSGPLPHTGNPMSIFRAGLALTSMDAEIKQVLTLESSSNQIDKCCKRGHVWVAGGRNGANRIMPSTPK